MLKDIKLGFKLLRYGYKLKLNVIMFVFFAVIGIASDIMSKGTSIIGGVYFMMCGMFTFQLIMSMDVSDGKQSCCFHIFGNRKSHSDTEFRSR